MTNDGNRPANAVRLDKWLWRARFFKSRSLAAGICALGRVRVGGNIVRKAHYAVRVGDVLTIPSGHRIRVVRIDLLGVRRDPPAEARTLYSEIKAAGTGEDPKEADHRRTP